MDLKFGKPRLIRRRTFLQGGGAAAALAAMPFPLAFGQALPSFRGQEYVAQSFGGETGDRFQKAIYDPFDKVTGATAVQVAMQSAPAFARMRAEARAPQVDLYTFSGGQERAAAAEGLTETLSDVPNFDLVPASFREPNRQWVTISNISQGLIYRTDKFKEPPRSYKDLFRPELEGHIAFMGITTSYGMDFLVMLARTFGGSENNIEAGFQNMAKLSPKATIFKAAAEIPTLFAQGDIWVMPNDSGNAFKNRVAGLPVAFAAMEEGSPSVSITACIPKAAKNAALAKSLVNYALGPEGQTALAEQLRWAPVNPNVVLPEEIARDLPKVSDLLALDRDVINAKRAVWTERWNKEIGR